MPGKVFVTSQAELPPHLSAYRLQTPIDKVHAVLAGASIFVGESPTMARPKPGLDRHEWESELATLEPQLEDDPASALPGLADLVERMLLERGYIRITREWIQSQIRLAALPALASL